MGKQTITWVGHGSWKFVTVNGTVIYIDPWIVGNPACKITLEDTMDADIVCVTHGHDDHIGNAIDICKRSGAVLVTLIPTLIYGAMTKGHGLIYFITAGLVYIAAICTCSRNALLFGTLVYAVSLIIAVVKTEKKRRRIAFAVFIAMVVVTAIAMFTVFRDETYTLFKSYVNQGMSDSGRFEIWRDAWAQFLDNRLFGAGFYTSDPAGGNPTIGGVPFMVHNTPLEFLSAAGIFGLLAYFYYRAETIRPLLVKPTLGKTMLGLSYLIIVAEGLLDVFVLGFWMMLYPFAVMAVVYRIYEMQMEREPKRRRK